jgi:hypothetical protein
LSRFRIFVLLAALAALATAFAACGSSDKSSANPQEVLDDATLSGVTSGNLELTLGIDSEGKEGGNLDVRLAGPFKAGAKTGSLPQLGMTVSAHGTAQGDKVDFDGGLTLLSDHGYVNYEGTDYEIDPTTFGFVKSGFEQAQQGGSAEEANPADLNACQEAAEGFKVGDFAKQLVNDGSADVDGTSTTKVSGELDVGGAIDAIIKLAENPACSAQLEAAGPLPIVELEEAKGELSSAVKKAHVEVYVGDDDIIRRIAAELTVEPKDAQGEKVEVELDLTLSEVNEEPEISTPANAKPLEGLFQKLGVNPLELLELSSGEGLGNLLEGITGSEPFGGITGGSGSGSKGSGGSGGGASSQDYLDCLKEASTPVDLQRCASLIQ